MTRQQLAEQIGLSVDALRKIEAGVNGAKIDTLISIAELFHITLDYLVCGCERKAEVDDLLVGLKEKEVQFICCMEWNIIVFLNYYFPMHRRTNISLICQY